MNRDYCEKTCKWNRKSDQPCERCPEPEILSENEPVLQLFSASTTQFRQGFSGPTGLDYPAVKLVADSLDQDFLTLLPGIQVCEREYLNIVYSQQKKQQEKRKHG